MFHPMRDYCYIAIDWGSARLNAFLCCLKPEQTVEIIDEITAVGVQKGGQDYASIFRDITAKWREEYGLLPVFLGGQIGSELGWEKSPYIACPVAPLDIVTAQIEFEYMGQKINVLPGVSCTLANGHLDIMRSEEIQILGWLQASATHRNGTYLLCLPGFHTKWVVVKDGIIDTFKTTVTGELYDLLKHSSLIVHASSDAVNLEAFDSGAAYILASNSNSLVHDLFSVRSKQLFEPLTPCQADSYLSGVLISSDVRATFQTKEWNFDNIEEVIIIGESHISSLFERVIRNKTKAVKCFHGKQTTVLGFAAVRQRQLAQQNT